jgi:copper chaperone CopZ|tara:strand:+ start:1747 stop:2178 length:432 start_codon:yes stop_codon:yes gene_type:complete
MKNNLKIVISLIVGVGIGFVLADSTLFNSPVDENNVTSISDSEQIVELMGTETSFGVKGNCKMCKSNIETAALSLDGVLKADWDVKTKQVSLVYDDQMIDLTSIHQAISNSGYGTDLNELNKEAYDNLPLCCQYDPEMKTDIN